MFVTYSNQVKHVFFISFANTCTILFVIACVSVFVCYYIVCVYIFPESVFLNSILCQAPAGSACAMCCVRCVLCVVSCVMYIVCCAVRSCHRCVLCAVCVLGAMCWAVLSCVLDVLCAVCYAVCSMCCVLCACSCHRRVLFSCGFGGAHTTTLSLKIEEDLERIESIIKSSGSGIGRVVGEQVGTKCGAPRMFKCWVSL